MKCWLIRLRSGLPGLVFLVLNLRLVTIGKSALVRQRICVVRSDGMKRYFQISTFTVPSYLVFLRLRHTGTKTLPTDSPLLLRNHRTLFPGRTMTTSQKRRLFVGARRRSSVRMPQDQYAEQARVKMRARSSILFGGCLRSDRGTRAQAQLLLARGRV